MFSPIIIDTSDTIYDSGYGFFVPKLARDETIPNIVKIEGTTWTPVCTVKGQEKHLTERLIEYKIPVYMPQIILEGKNKRSIPMFDGIIFAALSQENKKAIEGELLVSDIRDVSEHNVAELVFSDLIFMTMAEQICRYFPFRYIQEVSQLRRPGDVEMPMKINNFGDCRLISNLKNESSQMYFNFLTTQTIIKFELTLFQFRSLLLSKFLFSNQYCG